MAHGFADMIDWDSEGNATAACAKETHGSTIAAASTAILIFVLSICLFDIFCPEMRGVSFIYSYI